MCFRRKHNVGARAELDQADALTASNVLANLLCKHNPARNQPGNLLEDDLLPFAFHRHHVLLVFVGAGWPHGVEELALAVFGTAHNTADRGAVYVNIKHIQKNTDPGVGHAIDGAYANVGHFAISRGNQCPRFRRNNTIRIAKKPHHERCHQQRDSSQPEVEISNHGCHEQ